jgi:restriction endonuclease Mrr
MDAWRGYEAQGLATVVEGRPPSQNFAKRLGWSRFGIRVRGWRQRLSKGQNSLDDYVSAICSQRSQSASATEATYLAENVSAMTKMMFDMGIRPSGNID